MSWVDVVIVGLAVLAALRGWSAGAARQIGTVIGLVVGFVAATAVAPRWATNVASGVGRPAVALTIVVVGTVIGSSLGSMVGGLVHRSMRVIHLGTVDRVVGAGVGIVGSLALSWLTAGLVAVVAWGSVAAGIQDSAILRAMNGVLPPVPAIEGRVQSVLRNADLPNVFASLIAPRIATGVVHLGPTVSPVASPLGVVKVLAGGGCPLGHEGTAFVVAPGEVVTNAHVVAGATVLTVAGYRASVALFDPISDIAVLRVPGLRAPALRLSSVRPAPGTPARVVGFPLDGSRTLAPAQLRGTVTGSGRDIYNRVLVTRTYLVVAASIAPGNSGSPVIVRGRVVGVIVSKSLGQNLIAYAIPTSSVARDLARTPPHGSQSTEGCTT